MAGRGPLMVRFFGLAGGPLVAYCPACKAYHPLEAGARWQHRCAGVWCEVTFDGVHIRGAMLRCGADLTER